MTNQFWSSGFKGDNEFYSLSSEKIKLLYKKGIIYCVYVLFLRIRWKKFYFKAFSKFFESFLKGFESFICYIFVAITDKINIQDAFLIDKKQVYEGNRSNQYNKNNIKIVI